MTSEKNNNSLADFFLTIPPSEKKKQKKTQRHGVPAHKQEWRSEIKACQKGADLSRLMRVQMSQCGWISSGIFSAPSFKNGGVTPHHHH